MQSLPPLPSLQALRILDAAVLRKSFSAAALDLGLTHGAVSRQIRQLEVRVGAVLFRRRGARMEPSEAAIAMAARARHALRAIGDMFDRPSPHTVKQRLRLATTSSFARFWLTPRLAELRSISGAQIVAIETGVEPILFERGKVDVAIRYGRGGWPGAQARLLGLERTFPVASAAFARQRKIWDAAAIAHAPLIANAFVSWRAWLNAARLPSSGTLNVVLETGDSNFSLDAAAAGVGVALARARLARGMLARGELIALSDIAFDDGYAYHLAWPADGRCKSAVSALGEWLAYEFEQESRVLGFPAVAEGLETANRSTVSVTEAEARRRWI